MSVTRLTKSSYVDRKTSTGTELANAMNMHAAPAATGDVVRLDALSIVLKPPSFSGTWMVTCEGLMALSSRLPVCVAHPRSQSLHTAGCPTPRRPKNGDYPARYAHQYTSKICEINISWQPMGDSRRP